MKSSVILTTYNRPDMLSLVLKGYLNQTDQNFDLVVADDGSSKETEDLVKEYEEKSKFSILHCWQPDRGFRAAKIRNKAAKMSDSDYLIFSDGDCVPHSRFVATHKSFSEHGFFLAGNRVLLSKKFTDHVIKNDMTLTKYKHWELIQKYFQRDINRLAPLLSFPDSFVRKLTKRKWKGVKTCNLSLWKKDFFRVNGLDESYQGWGLEDSDLAVRLINSGVFHKSVRYASPVFHLWHLENSNEEFNKNLSKLENTINKNIVIASQGINQNVVQSNYD